jgi:type I restriction enzyme, S subunit
VAGKTTTAEVPEVVERALGQGTFSVEKFIESFPSLVEAAGSMRVLRSLLLDLAVRGRLGTGAATDSCGSDLLDQIEAAMGAQIASGTIRPVKTADESGPEEPFPLPARWVWAKVADTFDVVGGIQKTPLRAPKKNHHPYLRVENVQRGRLDLARTERFELQPGEIDRWRLRPSDLLVVEGNGSETEIGRCALWGGEIEDCVHQNHIIRCRPVGRTWSPFTLLFLNSPSGMAEMRTLAITTSGLYSLSVGKIRGIWFPLPPLAEQKRIVARVDQLIALIDQLEAKQNRKRDLGARFTKASLETLTTAESPQSLTTAWTRLHSNWPALFNHSDNLDDMRRAVLELAAQGRLVSQNEDDGNSRDLLDQIAQRKMERIANGELRKSKPLPCLTADECSFPLPSKWIWARLGDAFDVRDGTHDTPKYVQEGVPLVTSKNLYGGFLDLSNTDLISEEAYREIAERSEVSRYDILFAMIGSIGNPVIVDVDAKFGIKNVALFKYDDLSLACPAFLLQMLRWAAPRMRALSAGAVQSFVSLGFLRSFPIPFPPLAEQKRIVAKVEHLMKLCDALEAALRRREDRAAKLAEAVVQEMVA